jgi:hypothetical protein
MLRIRPLQRFCWLLQLFAGSLWLVVAPTPAATSASQAEHAHGGDKAMAARAIARGLQQHTAALMSLPGVVGTAQSLCDGQPCIKVFVVQSTPALEQQIRHILAGYPVAIQETGTMQSRPPQPN